MNNVLLDRAARIIDSGKHDPQSDPLNPLTNELHILTDRIALVTSFARVAIVRTDEGLVLFDTSTGVATDEVLAQLRSWSDERIHTVFYTHGHMDHVTGSGRIRSHAIERGETPPRFVGHANIARRWERYRESNDFNLTINSRQNGHLANPNFTIGPNAEARARGVNEFVPEDVVVPDEIFEHTAEYVIGGIRFVLHHVLAETDDHCWIWMPDLEAVVGGDLISWNFPNAGNPQKVQRYPMEWAQALRAILAVAPELYIPMHGLPIPGASRISTVLGDTAAALESIVSQTLAAMNRGLELESVIGSVELPTDLMCRPWLLPRYDDPEFVIRAVWRSYAGWWDGNPAHLKPAVEADLALALSRMSSKGQTLLAAAEEAARHGSFAVATQLAAWALGSTPDDVGALTALESIYRQRAAAEPSTMCRGVFIGAADQAAARAAELLTHA